MAYDNYPSVRTRMVPIDSSGNPIVSGNQIGVTSLNGQAGSLTLTGAGLINVNTVGSTITVSASGMGTGDVVGPSGATANAIAVYNGTTGKLIKDSQILINANEISNAQLALSGNNIAINPRVSLNVNLDDSQSGNQQFNVNFSGESYTTISAQFGNVFVGKNLQLSNPASSVYPTNSGTVTLGIPTNPFSGLFVNNNITANGALAVSANNNIDMTSGQYMTLTSTNADLYANASGNMALTAQNGNNVLNAALNAGINAGVSVNINASSGITATSATDVNINANGGSIGIVAASQVNILSASGINTQGDIVPFVSGNNNLGSSAIPFSGTYSNQYATSINNGAIATGAVTIDWNNGSSAVVDFAGQPSGAVITTLTNGINGSTYTIQTLNNAAGTNSITWASGLKWSNGNVGDLTASGSAIDFFTFYFNGTDYLSSVSPNFF